MCGLIPLVNDNHVDNNLKEILVYVYYGSNVNNRPENMATIKKSQHTEIFLLHTITLVPLTFTTIWAISVDDKLVIFFPLFFPENRIWHFMLIVSMKCQILLGTIRKIFQDVIC